MLRQTFPLTHALVGVARVSSSRGAPHISMLALRGKRLLSTSSQPQIESKGINEAAVKGVEGRHYADAPAHNPVTPSFNAESPVTGDWVLFHPVYSPQELKSVTVSLGYEHDL